MVVYRDDYGGELYVSFNRKRGGWKSPILNGSFLI